MNDAVNSAKLTDIFTSLASSFDPGSGLDGQISEVQPYEFAEILSDQELLSGFLLQLRELLPAEEFSRVAALLTGGNGLPLAAEVAGETGTGLNPEMVQALFARLGLSPEPMGRWGPAGGDSATEPDTPGISRFGLVHGSDELIIARPSDRGLERVAYSAIKAAGPASEPCFDPLSVKPGLDLTPAELRTPMAERVPELLRTLPVGDQPGVAPAAPLTAGYGTTGRMGLEVATAPSAPGQAALELEVPLGKGSWEQGLGERVLWLVGRSIQGASLRINPPHLGPIDIQLTLQNDQASVSFGAQHGVVREALEAAIPRLREMFGENNLQLLNVNVGQHGSGDARPHGENGDRNADAGHGTAGEGREWEGPPAGSDAAAEPVRYYRSDSLLDDYA